MECQMHWDGELTARDLVRLIVMGPADMPSGCGPRPTSIGDLTPERANTERLIPSPEILDHHGFLAGEQFGCQRDDQLVAQHGVLLFARPSGAHEIFTIVTAQAPSTWQVTRVEVGDEAIVATATRTSELVWRTGPVVQALIMRREERRDIVSFARHLDRRARHVHDTT